jgi:hypothetical protein
MSESAAEFVVVGEVEGTQLFDEPYRTVIGRCGDLPIHVGDRFEFIVQFAQPETIADYENEPVEISREAISLTVRHIRAYERDRQLLDRGMTGSLVLTGAGIEKVSGGCTLLACSPTSGDDEAASERVDVASLRSFR